MYKESAQEEKRVTLLNGNYAEGWRAVMLTMGIPKRRDRAQTGQTCTVRLTQEEGTRSA
jgi:hypothetical protein